MMKGFPMQLVLGLAGLPGAEIGLVKTILRLSSTLEASWTVVDSGPCDVVLLDEAGTQQPSDPAAVVIKVQQRGLPAAGTCLYRPIRAEELIERLNAESARRVAGAVAPPAVVSSALPTGQRGQARLRRWPPFALLQGRPGHLHLATLLSKHALTANRLSVVSNRPLLECEAFLDELEDHKLLVWQPMPAAVPSAPTVRATASVHAQPRRGLLHTLREKLGIARSRA
ncbi:MAG: hypothetical protein EOO23_07760 [Comamonadaceae bacterium]|nr:MAG: hypothetical protein EOO23_07760 [Comamonadaceae bacterium]